MVAYRFRPEEKPAPRTRLRVSRGLMAVLRMTLQIAGKFQSITKGSELVKERNVCAQWLGGWIRLFRHF